MKGSIPARKDANAKLYGTYLKWALKQWKTDKLAGSFSHGVVTPNAWKTKVDTALGLFLQTKDVSALQKSLASAAKARLGEPPEAACERQVRNIRRWGPGCSWSPPPSC